MFVENLVFRKDIADVLENRCCSVGGRLSRENRKTILADFERKGLSLFIIPTEQEILCTLT